MYHTKQSGKYVLEKIMHTIFHRIKNKIARTSRAGKQNRRIISDQPAYQDWCIRNETDHDAGSFSVSPMLSVILPVYADSDMESVQACLNSLQEQRYERYELLVICTEHSKADILPLLEHSALKEKAKIISCDEQTNFCSAAMKCADGEYLVVTDPGYCFSPRMLEEFATAAAEDRADLVYCDEDQMDIHTTIRKAPYFKPDWSPDTLLSFPYIGPNCMVRTSIAMSAAIDAGDYGRYSSYDLALRVSEQTIPERIVHLPQVLCHRLNGSFLGCSAKDSAVLLRLRNDALARRGISGSAEPVPGTNGSHILYEVPSGTHVSIIIPSKDNPEMLFQCLNSIFRVTSGISYDVVLVDNGSCDENRERISSFIAGKPVTYVYQAEPFNFSAMCNRGAKAAKGNLLLFLNDDIVVPDQEADWLCRMAGHALQAHIGAVGAKLLYPGASSIQHTGIINLRSGPSHALIGMEDSTDYYFGRNRLEQNWIGVTGACLMTEKTKFSELGGFDETFPIAYNDVDLCFRMIEHGWFNVSRMDIHLIHYESVSRGRDALSEEKRIRLENELERLNKKHPAFRAYDPFYNVNLVQDGIDYRISDSISSGTPVSVQEIVKEYAEIPVSAMAEYGADAVYLSGTYRTGDAAYDESDLIWVILETEGNPSCMKYPAAKRYRWDETAGKAVPEFACTIRYEDLPSWAEGGRAGLRIDSGLRRRT